MPRTVPLIFGASLAEAGSSPAAAQARAALPNFAGSDLMLSGKIDGSAAKANKVHFLVENSSWIIFFKNKFRDAGLDFKTNWVYKNTNP